MKQVLPAIFLLFSFSVVSAQSSQWTWIGGDSTYDQPGVYGSKGVAGTANKPGARYDAVTWTDAQGNLWLFGGEGYTTSTRGYLNDLWKYTVLTNQWTWVNGDSIPSQYGVYGTRGIVSPANKPGGRSGAVSWTDATGNFWLFGGEGYAASGIAGLNDLWKYVPSTGQWTWVSGDQTINEISIFGTRGITGSAAKPGARFNAVGWLDPSGNLWLFSGSGTTRSGSGILNDLWKYTVSTSQWTWVSGDTIPAQFGVYGTKGITSAINKPGARYDAVSWTDASGNLWLFGGNGNVTRSDFGELNDLWKYSPASGQWTWMSGDNLINQYGIYGTKGITSAANKPGSRENSASWTDLSGNFWLLGGGGYAANDGGVLNDLWKYAPSTNSWTWMGGDNIIYQAGVYGTKGTAASANKPGSRFFAANWTDVSGNFWLFGGDGYAANGFGFGSFLNDLWKYTAPGASLSGQFSDFTAQKQQQSVLLNWKAVRNESTPYFIIERSYGSPVYDSIGVVTAVGATASVSRYSFIDTDPLQSMNFYRLRQPDQHGNNLYSAIAKVVKEEIPRLTIIQNPVQSTLRINVQLPADQKLTLQINDMNGNLLISEERQGNQGSSLYSIPVGQLQKGTYIIHVQSERLNSTGIFIKL